MGVCDECYFSNRAPKIINNEISLRLFDSIIKRIKITFWSKNELYHIALRIGQIS